jgi:hypothetical protein
VLLLCAVLLSAYAENSDKTNLSVNYNYVNKLSQKLPVSIENCHMLKSEFKIFIAITQALVFI